MLVGSDSKCGFGRDCGFGCDREKSLKCGSRVPYRAENAVRPTQKPFRYGRFVADRPHFESLLVGKGFVLDVKLFAPQVLLRYGNKDQLQEWLIPLLEGRIRSGFAMTEPQVASSDATNIECSIKRYVSSP